MVRKRAGFSLVELMITLAILAFLLLVGASLTVSWANGARVQEAKSKLQQAYGMAVAIAQRNSVGAALSGEAAAVKLSAQALMVCSGRATDCTTETASWKAELPGNTTVSIGGASAAAGAAQTLAFDNTGAASTATTYSITCGNKNESGTLR